LGRQLEARSERVRTARDRAQSARQLRTTELERLILEQDDAVERAAARKAPVETCNRARRRDRTSTGNLGAMKGRAVETRAAVPAPVLGAQERRRLVTEDRQGVVGPGDELRDPRLERLGKAEPGIERERLDDLVGEKATNRAAVRPPDQLPADPAE